MADETKPRKNVALKHMDDKLETQSVPKKQSLKEWAMAGGGVPAQYKGREHVWRKQVQKYAAGGEVYNTTPDMADSGQINQAPAFSKGGTVKNAVKSAVEGVVEGVKPLVDRLNMHFKDVTKRVPELQEGAQKIQGGEMTPAEYEKLVKKYKPVKPYEFIPKPATRDEAINALTADKRDLYGTPSSMLKAGDPVGLRLDIPAYSDHGVWVPAVHRQAAGFGAGDRVGYESVAGVMNPTFGMSEKAALSIAAGKPKGTIATIKGEWNPTDEATAVARAQEYLNNPEWVQVGMDPERHGYFYDRRTMKPITAAEEAIQVGPLVLAKKPQYGNKKDFKYAEGGDVHMEDGGAAFGVFPQMKPKRSKQDPEAAKNAPLDFLRGRIAGTLGMPGDIESLIRMLPGLDERTYLPTSEYIEQRLPFRSDAPVSRAAAGLGSLTANPFDVVKAGKVAGKAAQSAKPVVGKALEDYMFNQGLAMPVVKPKGGNWLGGNMPSGSVGNVDKMLDRYKTTTVAGQTPAERIPLHERALLEPGLNDEGRATIQRHLDTTKGEAAVDKWIENNIGNYIKKDMATPTDPVRLMFERRAQEIEGKFQVDMSRAERTRARAEAETDPRRQANLMRQAAQQEEQAKFDRDFANENATHLPREEDRNLRLNSDREILDNLKNKRQQAGFSPEGMAVSDFAKRWENLTDEAIGINRAGDIQAQKEAISRSYDAEFALLTKEDEIKETFRPRLIEKLTKSGNQISDKDLDALEQNLPISQKAEVLGEAEEWNTLRNNFLSERAKVNDNLFGAYNNNRWIDKLDPETNVYSAYIGDLGIDHVVDVIRQDVAAGRIRPEQLNKLSMDQAIQRTAEFNMEQAKKMAEAQIKATEGMPVYKDYPEGYKWIELTTPKPSDVLPEGWTMLEPKNGYMRASSPDGVKVIGEDMPNLIKNLYQRHPDAPGNPRQVLEDALKYEGDTMGHCVGGYCPDVIEGRSRIFSLRDAKGEPHVTVETQPKGAVFSDVAKHIGKEEAERLLDQGVTLTEMIKNIPDFQYPQRIKQIKGKQNAAPKEEYLPFVQDFVRSGQWSDVGDLRNTGLIKNDGKYMTQGEYDDYLLNQLQPPPVEGMKVGGVVKGIGALKQSIMGGGAEAAKAERVAALRQSGLSAAEAKARVELAEQAAEMKQAIRASEALAKIEGKHLNITQADRTKVGNGYLGGPGFSGLQMKEGPHKDVGAVWGVKNTGTAKTMLGGFNKPLGNEYFTTMIGSPTQHQSNQMVFDKLYKDFTAQAKKGNLDSALRQKINDRLASAVDKDGNPIFPPDIDILSNNFKKQATTFDQRALAGNVLGGVGVGGKKGQIIDYEKIIRETTDPFLLDTPSGDLGYRIWTPSGEVIERPDLHPAFPAIATGEDLGVEFKPADKNILLAPFLEKFRLEKGREPGYMDMTRGRPVRVQVTEPILRNLEESGNKKGGAIGGLSQATRG